MLVGIFDKGLFNISIFSIILTGVTSEENISIFSIILTGVTSEGNISIFSRCHFRIRYVSLER